MALLCVSGLIACAGSTPSIRATVSLPALPSAITRCDRAVLMLEVALSKAEVERLWARDRAALVKCGMNLKAVVAFYEDLSNRLNAVPQ